jgi:hypothetical protein
LSNFKVSKVCTTTSASTLPLALRTGSPEMSVAGGPLDVAAFDDADVRLPPVAGGPLDDEDGAADPLELPAGEVLTVVVGLAPDGPLLLQAATKTRTVHHTRPAGRFMPPS